MAPLLPYIRSFFSRTSLDRHVQSLAICVLGALHAAADIAAMIKDPAIRIEPAWKVSHLYGMPCAFYHQLPAAWYLAARFSDELESAVLHAINGGDQNQSRAMLTGALVWAHRSALTVFRRAFLRSLNVPVSCAGVPSG